MYSKAHRERRLRFGDFLLDPRAGELCRNGTRIRLQEQPLRVLLLLLERPGEVVTREDLKHGLWGANTFVDFDNSLNIAVKKLRSTLGDDASSPRYIETLPKRGYRFLDSVTTDDPGWLLATLARCWQACRRLYNPVKGKLK